METLILQLDGQQIMRKLLIYSLLLLMAVTSCSKRIDDDFDENPFCYDSSEKIYMTKVKNRIFIMTTPDITLEQYIALIHSNVSLRQGPLLLREPFNWEKCFSESYAKYVPLESKDGKEISPAIIEFFKSQNEVASVEYMYIHLGAPESFSSLHALTDIFRVGLKNGTTYAQMHKLAEKYNCRIEENVHLSPNAYFLHVSKFSKLNAIQTANRFYESRLFEFSEPILGFFLANVTEIIKIT